MNGSPSNDQLCPCGGGHTRGEHVHQLDPAPPSPPAPVFDTRSDTVILADAIGDLADAVNRLTDKLGHNQP